MKDGRMARIVAWSHCEARYKGRLVQRCGKALVTIGQDEDSTWPDAFADKGLSDDCRVEILPDGKYTLEVFDNQ